MFQSSIQFFFSILNFTWNLFLNRGVFIIPLCFNVMSMQLLAASSYDYFEEECSICVEDIDPSDEDSVFEFTCTTEKSHFFHKQCMLEYIKTLRIVNPKQTSFDCPICRRKFLMTSLPLTFSQKKILFDLEFQEVEKLLIIWGLPRVSLEKMELVLEEAQLETMYVSLLRDTPVTFLASRLYTFFNKQEKAESNALKSKGKKQRDHSCCIM